jgi:alkylhydroperoxidase family enzyme
MEEAVQSRMSNPGVLVPEIKEVAGALYKAGWSAFESQNTLNLIGLRAGQIVGNTYVTMRSSTALRKDGETEERITAVASWRDAPYFTDAERAALALVEAVFQPNTQGERVSDEVYAEAAKHYDAKSLATLMVSIGQLSFWTAVALIGKPVPGVPEGEQWT